MAKIGLYVKMLMAHEGMGQTDLAKHWGCSRQAVTNKFYRDSFSVADLVSLANIAGAKLSFEFPDGQRIFLDPELDERTAPKGDSGQEA